MKNNDHVKEYALNACFVIGALVGFSVVSFACRKVVDVIFD